MSALPHNDIAVSTRVRLARNIRGLPFPARVSEKQAARVVEMVTEPVLKVFRTHRYLPIGEDNRLEARTLVERHLISPELYAGKKARGVILSPDEQMSIMIGEEDHIRIQAIRPGFCLDDTLTEALRVDDVLDEVLPIAFDEKWGYLTACPTNLGTGLRASVMLHLPLLTDTGNIREIEAAANKMGLALRGLYGEGTGAQGALYQISNQITLGVDESQIVARVGEVVSRISDQERALQNAFRQKQPTRFSDRVGRAWGLLTHARLLTTGEAMSALSDVRLGLAAGELTGIPLSVIDELTMGIQVGHLTRHAGGDTPMSAAQRDEARATLIRERLLI